MTVSQAWLYLFIAGIFEISLAVSLRFSQGFTRLMPSIFLVVSTIISFYLLAKATSLLPIGTAYAVWTGIGAAGTVLVGIFFLGETINAVRLICVAAIILGVIGLKLGG